MVLLRAASKGMAQIIQLKEIKNEWSKVCRQLPEQKVMIAYQASVPEPVFVSRTAKREVRSSWQNIGTSQQVYSVVILPAVLQSDL